MHPHDLFLSPNSPLNDSLVWAVWNLWQGLCTVQSIHCLYHHYIVYMGFNFDFSSVSSFRPRRGCTWVQSHCGCQQPHCGDWEWAEWVETSCLVWGSECDVTREGVGTMDHQVLCSVRVVGWELGALRCCWTPIRLILQAALLIVRSGKRSHLEASRVAEVFHSCIAAQQLWKLSELQHIWKCGLVIFSVLIICAAAPFFVLSLHFLLQTLFTSLSETNIPSDFQN